MIDFKTISREAFMAGAAFMKRKLRVPNEGDFQVWWAQRMQFVHGAHVRFKEKKRGRTMTVGTIKNRPGPNARTVYVVWRNAFAGYVNISELEVVP